MASPLSKKSVDVRDFELSLQQCGTIEEQRRKMEKRPEAYLKEVVKIVVQVLDFKKRHPEYSLPKSFSLGMCIHKLKGRCTFDSDHSHVPCLNPHRFALRDVAIHIKNMSRGIFFYVLKPCKFKDACHFKDHCKFLHDQQDLIIYQNVQKIFQDRAGHSHKKSAPADAWVTIGKGPRSIPRQQPLPSLNDNLFSCLDEEDAEISPASDTDEPKALDSSLEDVNHASSSEESPSPDTDQAIPLLFSDDVILPSPAEEETAAFDKMVQDVFLSVFDQEDEPAVKPDSPQNGPRKLVAFTFDSSFNDVDFEALESPYSNDRI